MPFFKSNGRDG